MHIIGGEQLGRSHRRRFSPTRPVYCVVCDEFTAPVPKETNAGTHCPVCNREYGALERGTMNTELSINMTRRYYKEVGVIDAV